MITTGTGGESARSGSVFEKMDTVTSHSPTAKVAERRIMGGERR